LLGVGGSAQKFKNTGFLLLHKDFEMHLFEISLSLFHDGGVGWKHTRRRGKDV